MHDQHNSYLRIQTEELEYSENTSCLHATAALAYHVTNKQKKMSSLISRFYHYDCIKVYALNSNL